MLILVQKENLQEQVQFISGHIFRKLSNMSASNNIYFKHSYKFLFQNFLSACNLHW